MFTFTGIFFWDVVLGQSSQRWTEGESKSISGVFTHKYRRMIHGIFLDFLGIYISTKEVRSQAAVYHSSNTSVNDLKRNNALEKYLWLNNNLQHTLQGINSKMFGLNT